MLAAFHAPMTDRDDLGQDGRSGGRSRRARRPGRVAPSRRWSQAARRRHRRRQRRRDEQAGLQHLRQRPLQRVRWPRRVPGRRRRAVPEPGDAAVRHPGDGAHRVLQLRGPVELTDKESMHRDIATSKAACGDAPVDAPSWARSAPARSPSTTPTTTTARTSSTSGRSPTRCRYEYRAIIDAGLQPADRLARPRDGRALPFGRQQHHELGPTCRWRSRPSTPRSRDPARAGPPARLLGQLRRPPPQATCRSPTSSARSSRPRSARSTPRAATRATSTSGACSRRSSFRRDVGDPRRDRHEDQLHRASPGRRRPSRAGRRDRSAASG